jgi:hypothetical protein
LPRGGDLSRYSWLLQSAQLAHCLVVGTLRSGDVTLDSREVFGPIEESGGKSGIGIVGAFNEFTEDGCFNALRSHESPGVGGDLVYKDALWVIRWIVGKVQALPEFLVSRCVFAGHNDLSAGESVAGRVAAGSLFAFRGPGASAELGVVAIGEYLCW